MEPEVVNIYHKHSATPWKAILCLLLAGYYLYKVFQAIVIFDFSLKILPYWGNNVFLLLAIVFGYFAIQPIPTYLLGRFDTEGCHYPLLLDRSPSQLVFILWSEIRQVEIKEVGDEDNPSYAMEVFLKSPSDWPMLDPEERDPLYFPLQKQQDLKPKELYQVVYRLFRASQDSGGEDHD